MDAALENPPELPEDRQPIERRAYDPNNLHPLDEEDRKHDDTSEGIDWDEILATTQDDFLAGRFDFDTGDYPTEEAAMVAMKDWLHGIFKEALDEIAATPSCITPSP